MDAVAIEQPSSESVVEETPQEVEATSSLSLEKALEEASGQIPI
jgi:hypothetical protein